MSNDSFVLDDIIETAVTELRPRLSSGGISILLQLHEDYYKLSTEDGDKPDEKFGYNETVSNIKRDYETQAIKPEDLIKLLKEVVTMRVYAVANAYATEITLTVEEVEDKVQKEIVRQTQENLRQFGVKGPGDVLGIPKGGGKRRKSKRRKSKRRKSMKRRKSKRSKRKTRRKKR